VQHKSANNSHHQHEITKQLTQMAGETKENSPVARFRLCSDQKQKQYQHLLLFFENRKLYLVFTLTPAGYGDFPDTQITKTNLQLRIQIRQLILELSVFHFNSLKLLFNRI